MATTTPLILLLLISLVRVCDGLLVPAAGRAPFRAKQTPRFGLLNVVTMQADASEDSDTAADDDSTAESVPAPEERKPFFEQMSESYREGYSKAQQSFKTTRRADIADLDASPLRRSDKLAGVLLAIVLVEAVSFGAAFMFAWLAGAVPGTALVGTAVPPQARLVTAAARATAFRSATRLPRLLAECLAVPYVLRAVAARAIEVRAEFVKDRASQAAGVLVALALLLRALNRTVLAGTTAPAAALLAAAIGRATAPLTSGPVVAPVVSAVGSAAEVVWGGALHFASRLVALDAAMRQTPINAALYWVADLERHLAPLVRLGAAALGAFFEEVVMPILKALGFLTVQTLG